MLKIRLICLRNKINLFNLFADNSCGKFGDSNDLFMWKLLQVWHLEFILVNFLCKISFTVLSKSGKYLYIIRYSFIQRGFDWTTTIVQFLYSAPKFIKEILFHMLNVDSDDWTRVGYTTTSFWNCLIISPYSYSKYAIYI